MQSPVGSCFIEYIWPARGNGEPEVLDRFPFWSFHPESEYFRNLAHSGVKCFYRSDPPRSQQIIVNGSVRTISPNAVRVVDEEGHELCRWTTSDEYEEVAGGF